MCLWSRAPTVSHGQHLAEAVVSVRRLWIRPANCRLRDGRNIVAGIVRVGSYVSESVCCRSDVPVSVVLFLDVSTNGAA